MGRDLPWLHDASHTINLLTSANAGRNWPNNHENIGAKGWAFLLPTVTPEACF